ncbi:BRO family protein [Zooshikella sp. RANM57]|uniref:BRO family protein n=1 Tax=Zooshikella sp. RANM57 TaxID=3425863 RepID=UPI003D6F6A37
MNIIPFQFESTAVRVINKEGEPWFVAKDVADLLGYKRTADAVRTHCKGVGEIQTPINGVLQTVKIIHERDVYRLIMKSKLPEAERFEEWVFGDVLPCIRKTGSYGVTQIDWNNPTQIAGFLAQSLQRVQEQDEEIAMLTPKAKFHDQVIQSEDSLTIAEAAKILDTGRNRLMQFLRHHSWINRFNEPYQAKIESGDMDLKLSQFEHPRQGVKDRITPLITGRGLVKLKRMRADFH